MLVLGLVVAVMALLLLGTSRGLWSYYDTTNQIRAKLAELQAAEEVKAVVTALVHDTDDLVKTPTELPEQLREVRAKLDAYEAKLEETLSQGRDPNGGVYEAEMVDLLREDLVHFEKTVVAEAREPVVEMVGDQGDQRKRRRRKAGEAQKPDPPNQQKHPLTIAEERLEDHTLDLRDHIRRELGERLNESRRHYQVALWIIIPSSIVGLLVTAGLLRSYYGWVFNPIRDLEAGVSRVAQGDFEQRIELHSGDEMEDLANAFNDMMGRLHDLYADLARQVNERSRQLVRSERLASVGFLAAGVAHEINNPLASIAFCSEALEARLTDLLRHLRGSGRTGEEHEIFSKYLKMIQEEAFRCKHITEKLLAFSRSGERRREPTDLCELVQAVLDVTQHLQSHKGKHITFAAPPGARVLAWVNGEEIKSVVLNLVVNALDSMEEGGQLTIRLGQRDGMAELQFTDTGCGMTQEVLENIFEPFFTRSRTGKGTGLGLTISHRIIHQHGGEIEAYSAGLDQGSTFTVRLPVQPQDQPQPAAELARAEGRPARRAA
jgi:signal transduction histidine kinase